MAGSNKPRLSLEHRMRPAADFKKLSKAELCEEMEIRRELIGQMQGNLWPAVLEKEIDELLRLYIPHQFDQLELPV